MLRTPLHDLNGVSACNRALRSRRPSAQAEKREHTKRICQIFGGSLPCDQKIRAKTTDGAPLAKVRVSNPHSLINDKSLFHPSIIGKFTSRHQWLQTILPGNDKIGR